MSTHLSIAIAQAIQYTPSWVWGVLALITYLGVRQVRDHVITSRRLAVAPVALGAFSLWGALSAFGLRADVVVAWATGMALTVAVNQWLALPRSARYEGEGRYALQGSVWPLLTMWAVFVVRYVANATLAMHHEMAHDTTFSVTMSVTYGALSGVFLARALRILRSRPALAALQTA